MKIKTQSWMRTASFWLALILIVTQFSSMLFLSFIVYLVFRISNTVGYHRLFCHRAYTCSSVWHWVFGIVGCICLQNSPVRWSITHLCHHRYADTGKDPYKKGVSYFIQFKKPQVDFVPHSLMRLLKESKMHKFLDDYSFTISALYGLICLLHSIDCFIYMYIIPVGFFVFVDGIHNTFAHNQKAALDRPGWELIIPMLGEWKHKTHHTNAKLVQLSKLDVGYWVIRLIQK